MDYPIIEIKNVGKRYNISHQRGRYITLRDVIANIVKNPFKYLAFRAKEFTGIETKEIFWALKDISFSVKKGEIVGIIGMNGAGKSTLLKILSQITPPATGEIKIRGRIGSLLEVGTGFHPELTGRENIFLNGAILGMSRKEIIKKFDQIVEFSGVEKFLDTPVKRYSSGMYVRLAFSVAAHMEPDVLIVDEVLAVGDAEFQKKCLGKMEEVTRQEGRTILFVSHNMAAIERLCSRSVLLEGGRLIKDGPTKEVIDAYLNRTPATGIAFSTELEEKPRNGTGDIRFTGVEVTTVEGRGQIKSHSKLRIKLSYTSDKPEIFVNPRVFISVIDIQTQQQAFRMDSTITADSFSQIDPEGTIICETGPIDLRAGKYSVTIGFDTEGINRDYIEAACAFEVMTDIDEFNYRMLPDKHTPDHLMRYSFRVER